MTAPPTPPPRSRRTLAIRSAIEVCGFIDELSPGDVGELMIAEGDAVRGAVFVEGGRVCWAAARGLSRRLSQLLAERARVEPEAMEHHYLACRADKRPLGEYLVERGVVAPGELRAALLQHTAESLHALCSKPMKGTWTGRSAGGYSARFTFTTTEVLIQTLAQAHDEALRRTLVPLDGCFVADEWAAAFVRTGARAAPDPIALSGATPRATQTVLAVGKWAASALDVAATFQESGSLLWVRAGSAALVAFREGGAIVAGQTNESGVARILNRRARRRREEGMRDGGV